MHKSLPKSLPTNHCPGHRTAAEAEEPAQRPAGMPRLLRWLQRGRERPHDRPVQAFLRAAAVQAPQAAGRLRHRHHPDPPGAHLARRPAAQAAGRRPPQLPPAPARQHRRPGPTGGGPPPGPGPPPRPDGGAPGRQDLPSLRAPLHPAAQVPRHLPGLEEVRRDAAAGERAARGLPDGFIKPDGARAAAGQPGDRQHRAGQPGPQAAAPPGRLRQAQGEAAAGSRRSGAAARACCLACIATFNTAEISHDQDASVCGACTQVLELLQDSAARRHYITAPPPTPRISTLQQIFDALGESASLRTLSLRCNLRQQAAMQAAAGPATVRLPEWPRLEQLTVTDIRRSDSAWEDMLTVMPAESTDPVALFSLLVPERLASGLREVASSLPVRAAAGSCMAALAKLTVRARTHRSSLRVPVFHLARSSQHLSGPIQSLAARPGSLHAGGDAQVPAAPGAASEAGAGEAGGQRRRDGRGGAAAARVGAGGVAGPAGARMGASGFGAAANLRCSLDIATGVGDGIPTELHPPPSPDIIIL